MDEKITIFDVARKAGVSKGTVDRVLHNRGEVSAKSAEKVRKAIEELNFHPNVYASLLASKKPKILACVMPRFTKNEFWEKVYLGFVRGGEAVSKMNIRLNFLFYDQYDAKSFEKVAQEALDINPSGVLMPTLFQDATRDFAKKLASKNVPYAYIDTKVEDDGNYLAFIGMPRYDSGTLCAALLTERCSEEEVDNIAIVRIKRDDSGMSDPTRRRREGFMKFIGEHFPKANIHNVFIKPSDPSAIQQVMSEFFAEHKDLRFVVMFNSRLHLIAKSLTENPVQGRRVIGFDDLSMNLDMLKDGLADVIIAQHIEDQSAKSVELLSDFILERKKQDVADNYVHIDILTKYNISNY